MARDIEPCHPPVSVNQKKAFVPYNSYYQKNTSASLSKQLHTPVLPQAPTGTKSADNVNNTAQRIRKAGECWRCGDKWVHGHKCTLIPNVHLMQQEVEDTGPLEQEEPHPEQSENIEEQHEQAMFISAYALGHQSTVQTPTIIISVNGKRAVALLDFGSSSSFMNEKFAIKSNCHMLPRKPRAISVAGGGTLISAAVVPNCPFQIAKLGMQHSFRVLDLPSHDIILGYDWFTLVSPVTFDVPRHQFSFTVEGQTKVTAAIFNTNEEVKEM